MIILSPFTWTMLQEIQSTELYITTTEAWEFNIGVPLDLLFLFLSLYLVKSCIPNQNIGTSGRHCSQSPQGGRLATMLVN